MHSSRVLLSLLGLVSSTLFANVANGAPIASRSLAFDVGLSVPCLLGCNITTQLSVLGNLQSKVNKDLSTIVSLSGSTDIDLSGLGEAYNTLINDVNGAVKSLGDATAITAYNTGAYLDAVGNMAGNLLVDVLTQAGSDATVPGIDTSLTALNNGLVGLLDNLNTNLGAALMPLIANTTASLETDVQIGKTSNLFASLWAILSSL
ncbi:hypothetical protein CALCODRAFT_558668 [Calocera cornea HHB12733]|uniref:Uncharacterized protein n=1 Tax=Calocera cornea HHB12733 TaxID=1353952 RepID=A0A165CT00_9BASI|nr:hypothetical protein CALCODRAFT_558668 [Calocera cornea HHB12733]